MRAPTRNRSTRVISPTIPPRCSVMTLEAIRYRAGSLQILNQLLLPHQTVYDEIRSVQDGYEAIKSMKVTGLLSLPPPPSHYRLPLPLPSRPACPLHAHLFPSCMFFCRVFCAPTASRLVLPYARRRAPAVGLYYCDGSTRQLPTSPRLSSPPKPPFKYSLNIIMCTRDKPGICTQLPTHEICPPLLLFLWERLLMNY